MTARAADLLQEAPAGNLLELLPEWEGTLGLPDPCAGPQPTIAARQAGVRAAIAARGGQSIPYFTAVAASLGYTITVQEFAPARYGRPNYGKPRYGKPWAHVWQVTAPAAVVTPARYGQHRAGEPYTTVSNRVLECTLNRIKPAHTVLRFNYTGPAAVADWNEGAWNRDAWATS